MIDRAENKAIPGPRMERGYISPAIPNGERLVCGSCHHIARPGKDVVHAPDCPWMIEERQKRAESAAVETK